MRLGIDILLQKRQDAVLRDCQRRAVDSRVVGRDHRHDEQEAEKPHQSWRQEFAH